MLESRHRLLDQIGIDQVLAYGLDRHRAFDARIERLVNDPHRALAEHAVDAVFPYGRGVSHGCSSALEHLDRLHHAGLHSPQRLGQNTDFVMTAGAKLSYLGIAESYFVGTPRQ